MKVVDLDLLRWEWNLFKEDPNNRHTKQDDLDFEAKEFIPEDIGRPDGPYKIGGMSAYYTATGGKGDPSLEIPAPTKTSGKGSIKNMVGNPWAPNEQKVFISLVDGRVSGARGNMQVNLMNVKHEDMVRPLEQGGLGATQTSNTSKRIYWMPAELFDIHVKNKKLK
jgi:hypothetical protein